MKKKLTINRVQIVTVVMWRFVDGPVSTNRQKVDYKSNKSRQRVCLNLLYDYFIKLNSTINKSYIHTYMYINLKNKQTEE